jgi:hypothetical protein
MTNAVMDFFSTEKLNIFSQSETACLNIKKFMRFHFTKRNSDIPEKDI